MSADRGEQAGRSQSVLEALDATRPETEVDRADTLTPNSPGTARPPIDTPPSDTEARVEGLLARVATPLAPEPEPDAVPEARERAPHPEARERAPHPEDRERAPQPEDRELAAPPSHAGLHVGQPTAVHGRMVTVRCRGVASELEAELAPGVSGDLVEQAVTAGSTLLLELAQGAPPLVVAVLQTQLPDELRLHAKRVEIEADEEIVLRSGHGALRIREDGEIELVGSRISALSRGLFRLVGRILRLN